MGLSRCLRKVAFVCACPDVCGNVCLYSGKTARGRKDEEGIEKEAGKRAGTETKKIGEQVLLGKRDVLS